MSKATDKLTVIVEQELTVDDCDAGIHAMQYVRAMARMKTDLATKEQLTACIDLLNDAIQAIQESLAEGDEDPVEFEYQEERYMSLN